MVQTASTSDMTKAYDPKSVEQRVYDFWVRGGYFTPVIDRSKKPYVVIMPPPNVTGELHMGHALTMALEDLMVRWHRMIGDPTLYLPGTDHAGIATQVVVERQLASDDKTRHDLGRQAFVDLVWEWVDQYGDRIYEQIKRLGASCDWTRRSFTLDEGPSKAVRTTFVNLYREGLIYRGERIVNWCPRCSTALSDLEVRHREEGSGLYHLRYRLQDSDDHLTIATTRPETLLGDTAVAVNPDDERYSHLVGRTAVLPVLGRVLPVIADDTVDTEFGTGALKVTPGHDHNDFDIGQRHGLDIVNVMNLDGTMNENAGPYEGKDRLAVRTEIVEELERDGLLEKVDPLQPRRGPLRPVRRDRGAHRVEAVVHEDGSRSPSRPSRPFGAARSGSSRSASPRSTTTGWRTSATGASAASSGGGTVSLSGTAATATGSRSTTLTRTRARNAALRR